jgi:serine/threonine protein kinase
MYEIYETERDVYLVMEFLEGGELISNINDFSFFSEKNINIIMRHLLIGLSYIH